jgi:hypothetical protein
MIAELRTLFLAAELPVNLEHGTIELAVPGAGLTAQQVQSEDAISQALAGRETDFNFSLIEPTAVGEDECSESRFQRSAPWSSLK